jgi:hypothetical protein
MSRNGLDSAAEDWNDAYVQGFNALKAADTEWSRSGEYREGAPDLKPVSLRQFLRWS